MKQQNLLTKMLLLFALVVGSVSSVWGQTFSWVKTDITKLNDGDVVVVLETAKYNRALLNTEATSSGSVKASGIVELSDDETEITSTVATNIQWIFNGSSTSFTLKSNDTEQRQLWCRDNNDALRVKSSSPSSSYVGTFTWDEEYLMMKSTSFTRYAGVWKNGDTDYQWRAYNSQTATNIKGTQTSFFKRTDASDTRETATWSINPTSAVVNSGESATIQLTTNYDGTLLFTSNNNEVATVSYNASTKIITVNGISVGTTTIVATGAATDKYKALSKSIDVTVNMVELDYNLEDIMSGFGYEFFDLTPEGSNNYAQPDVTSTDYTDNNGVKISIARAGSSYTKPRFDAAYLRLYKGNTFTVTAPTGSYITKVIFTEPSQGNDWKGTMTVNEGIYDNDSKTWYATKTGLTELVLTGTDDTNRIGGLKVYLMVSGITITPASGLNYISYSNTLPLDFTEVEGLTAFVVSTDNGTSVKLTEVKKVPAKTGLVLKKTGTDADYSVPVLNGEADSFTNLLIGTADGPKEVTARTVYVLNSGQFKLFTGTTIPQGKAYLPTSNGDAPALDLDFGEGTTGIQNIERSISDDQYYTLDGRRVAQPTKGLYILNGKKVILK